MTDEQCHYYIGFLITVTIRLDPEPDMQTEALSTEPGSHLQSMVPWCTAKILKTIQNLQWCLGGWRGTLYNQPRPKKNTRTLCKLFHDLLLTCLSIYEKWGHKYNDNSINSPPPSICPSHHVHMNVTLVTSETAVIIAVADSYIKHIKNRLWWVEPANKPQNLQQHTCTIINYYICRLCFVFFFHKIQNIITSTALFFHCLKQKCILKGLYCLPDFFLTINISSGIINANQEHTSFKANSLWL